MRPASGIGALVLAALACLLAIGWVGIATGRATAAGQALVKLESDVQLLAVSAHLLADESLQAYAVRTATTLGLRVTLIARDGTVLADSAIDTGDVAAMDNHANRPEVVEAADGGHGRSLRESMTTRVQYWYIARRVDEPGRVGFVRLAVPPSELPRPSWVSGWPMLLTAFLSMLLLIAIARRHHGHVLGQVDKLAATVETATSGPPPATPMAPLDRLAAAVRASHEANRERAVEADAKRALLTSIIGGMKEGLLLIGPDRRVQLANRSVREILDLDFDPTGRLLTEVIRHPDALADLEDAPDHDGTAAAPMVIRDPSGRSFELQVTPLPAGGESTPGLLVLFFDVTRLHALDAVRREFVGNVSHELRTPLTSINAFVETLLDGDLDDPAEARKFLEIVRRHAERMQLLIEDLTDLSAIETGSVRLERDELELGRLARDVVDQLRPLAETREVELRTELPEGLRVAADRRRVEQVLTNLVHNAIKFNRRGGRVVIRGEAAAGRVRLAVEDTGTGIPADSQDKIFNRFYQLDKARSHEHGGTGLGLAIVKHLMRLHGGTVRVQSELGRGATFTLEFPGGNRDAVSA